MQVTNLQLFFYPQCYELQKTHHIIRVSYIFLLTLIFPKKIHERKGREKGVTFCVCVCAGFWFIFPVRVTKHIHTRTHTHTHTQRGNDALECHLERKLLPFLLFALKSTKKYAYNYCLSIAYLDND